MKPRQLRKIPGTRGRDHVYTLRITLRDIQPPIWRRVVVRADTSLAELHEILQDVVGWQNYHLWGFTIGHTLYEAPDPEASGLDATKATLKKLGLEAGATFEYLYDAGDDWLHEVAVEEVLPADPELAYPVCVGGARACPPEDSGGAHRYAEILEILKESERADSSEVADWIDESFHPEAFDLRATNRILMLAYGGGGAV
jgi:hypothetical protein